MRRLLQWTQGQLFALQARPCAPDVMCIQCISQSLTDLSTSSNTPTLVEVCSPLCWRSCCCSWLGSRPIAACRATSRGGGASCGGCTAAGLLEAADAAAFRASSSARIMDSTATRVQLGCNRQTMLSASTENILCTVAQCRLGVVACIQLELIYVACIQLELMYMNMYKGDCQVCSAAA